MTTLDIDLDTLLDDRFDIELKQYWNLTEDEKNYITDVVITQVFRTLRIDPNTLVLYIRLLDDRILYSVYHEEYEHAEIYKRIRYSLIPF
jgi:hypothetical protein